MNINVNAAPRSFTALAELRLDLNLSAAVSSAVDCGSRCVTAGQRGPLDSSDACQFHGEKANAAWRFVRTLAAPDHKSAHLIAAARAGNPAQLIKALQNAELSHDDKLSAAVSSALDCGSRCVTSDQRGRHDAPDNCQTHAEQAEEAWQLIRTLAAPDHKSAHLIAAARAGNPAQLIKALQNAQKDAARSRLSGAFTQRPERWVTQKQGSKITRTPVEAALLLTTIMQAEHHNPTVRLHLIGTRACVWEGNTLVPEGAWDNSSIEPAGVAADGATVSDAMAAHVLDITRKYAANRKRIDTKLSAPQQKLVAQQRRNLIRALDELRPQEVREILTQLLLRLRRVAPGRFLALTELRFGETPRGFDQKKLWLNKLLNAVRKDLRGSVGLDQVRRAVVHRVETLPERPAHWLGLEHDANLQYELLEVLSTFQEHAAARPASLPPRR